MKNSEKWKKIGLMGLIVLILILVVFLIIHFFGDNFATLWQLLKNGDEDELQAYLNSQDEVSGLLSVYILTILQVVSIFFPGMIIQVVAGVIYGWWKAFLACYAGFVTGNVLVFYFARRFSNVIQNIMSMEKKNSWITEKINSTKPGFVFALACMIPGIPNGFIPYFASRTDIRTYQYAESVAVSSWIQILSNCVIGHFLIRGEYFYMVISIVLQVAIILLAIWKRDWFLGKGKRKDTPSDVKAVKE
jgi:uncharacterized membrane protein YdjX (TVP38/TMEM64 family)